MGNSIGKIRALSGQLVVVFILVALFSLIGWFTFQTLDKSRMAGLRGLLSHRQQVLEFRVYNIEPLAARPDVELRYPDDFLGQSADNLVYLSSIEGVKRGTELKVLGLTAGHVRDFSVRNANEAERGRILKLVRESGVDPSELEGRAFRVITANAHLFGNFKGFRFETTAFLDPGALSPLSSAAIHLMPAEIPEPGQEVEIEARKAVELITLRQTKTDALMVKLGDLLDELHTKPESREEIGHANTSFGLLLRNANEAILELERAAADARGEFDRDRKDSLVVDLIETKDSVNDTLLQVREKLDESVDLVKTNVDELSARTARLEQMVEEITGGRAGRLSLQAGLQESVEAARDAAESTKVLVDGVGNTFLGRLFIKRETNKGEPVVPTDPSTLSRTQTRKPTSER